jgi:hypothetical protein
MLTDVLKRIKANGGFLVESDVVELAASDRLRQVLCRFNNGRFLCAAQDVAHFVGIIEHSKEDWLRDVSLPTGDPIWRGDYTTNATEEIHRPMREHNARREQIRRNEPAYVDPDGNPHGSMADVRRACPAYFNESDCGGAFDGFTVTSDADSGL